MELNIPLFKEICLTPGPPGYESRIRHIVQREIEGYCDEITIDNMGNLIALKKGADNGPKVMVAAHMDEIGFMVNYIDDDGFIRFNPLGGFDPKTLTAQRVIVHGTKDLVGVMGSKPIHVMSAEERTKLTQITDYFIDMGMDTEEVRKYISVGDVITRERELVEIGDCVNSKSIDNRVAVFILIETLRELKDKTLDCNFYAVFTVQEEIGLRGAMVAAHQINPDFGIGLDTTIAFDVPSAKKHEMITKLGHGIAIKVMDSSVICDPRMVKFMIETAEKENIKFQKEILPAGGTDTGALQRFGRGGSIAGAISIPTRHLHQVIEMANKKDIRGGIDLLKACLSGIANYNWKSL